MLDGIAVRTPLVRLDVESDAEIWLKLELLQPVAPSRSAAPETRSCRRPTRSSRDGVLTASAGNMAQGVAYAARLRGVPATIVVPEHAPQTKIDAIERYGGRSSGCRTRSGGRCS